jgi:hypothetical protein
VAAAEVTHSRIRRLSGGAGCSSSGATAFRGRREGVGREGGCGRSGEDIQPGRSGTLSVEGGADDSEMPVVSAISDRSSVMLDAGGAIAGILRDRRRTRPIESVLSYHTQTRGRNRQ